MSRWNEAIRAEMRDRVERDAQELARSVMLCMHGRRLAIVGSRDYSDLDAVRFFVRALPSDVVLVTGGAGGVDRTAEQEMCILGRKPPIILRPDYKRFGGRERIAPLVRNTEIIDAADALVAFHDGVSKGTKDAIQKAYARHRRESRFGGFTYHTVLQCHVCGLATFPADDHGAVTKDGAMVSGHSSCLTWLACAEAAESVTA